LAQIVPVVSETLEAQIRNLLPSQRGFGEDLQASNVILPIIDLTAAAEGTNLPLYQQQALAFGSITSFSLNNSSSTLANSAGFWLFYGVSDVRSASTGTTSNSFSMTDGLSVKQIWKHEVEPLVNENHSALLYEFIVFLRSGDSVTASSDSNRSNLTGCYRQLADVNGTIVNPSGFTPQ